MVTRKAISAAFELIINDYDVRTVSYFCFQDGQEINKICRVRVTRNRKSTHDYRVQTGLMNYAEREYFKRRTRLDGVSPKVWMKVAPKKAATKKAGRK